MVSKKEFKNKLVFTTKDSEGNSLELAVKRPDAAKSKTLQKVYNRAYKDALDSGALLRCKIEQIAREQNIWSDEKEADFKKLQKELLDNEIKLLKGGNAGLTKDDAFLIALRMKEIRNEMLLMRSEFNSLDANTAESQAMAEYFNYAVFLCTIYPETGEQYYKNYDEYVEDANSSSQIPLDAGRYLSFLLNNTDPDYEKNLVENKFLIKYGYVDEKLRLINKDGYLVDKNGRRIRDDGRFINDKNQLVDAEGNLVDEEGNYIVEFAPFLEPETSEHDVKSKDNSNIK